MRLLLLGFVVFAVVLVVALIPLLAREPEEATGSDGDVPPIDPDAFPAPGEPSPWVDGRPVPGSADDRHRKGKP
jgi:hypothetical protein